MARRTLTLLLFITGASLALAGQVAPDVWTIDDVILTERAAGWEIAPDASFAVWVRSEVKNVGEGSARTHGGS